MIIAQRQRRSQTRKGKPISRTSVYSTPPDTIVSHSQRCRATARITR
jgi:hypothetical protein